MTEFILTSCVVGDIRERVPEPECMDELQKLANWREIYLKIDIAFLSVFVMEVTLSVFV
eukprot:CAMPEP_0185314648 /NCGR_PEP_ID=MMETSP1363-20130426/39558_1 /TAXON_ID=38817 /ORGANISM="Gephyrocapsa oceanica, Strain RCC1303" /LENGTH=58 /DNA_ID=CAMNT_0027912707 /DNA_START=31 /DNA_END=204 /DNA_ORIENTATION=-